MNIICSVDKNRGLGKSNSLLFKVPADMKHFREMTTGGVVIMGRTTLESLPGAKPLPNRTNIVLSKNPDFKADGAFLCRSTAELKEELKKYDTDKVFVTGGASVYRLLAPYCRYAYITEFDAADLDADCFLDVVLGDSDWQKELTMQKSEHDGLRYEINKYVNKRVKEL